MGYNYKVIKKDLAGWASDYYYVDEYKLTGDYIPTGLPESGLSDLFALDAANNIIYLSEWTSFGVPLKFRIWKIDGNNKCHTITEDMEGICAGMIMDGSDLVVSAFKLIDKEKVNPRERYGTVPVRPIF